MMNLLLSSVSASAISVYVGDFFSSVSVEGFDYSTSNRTDFTFGSTDIGSEPGPGERRYIIIAEGISERRRGITSGATVRCTVNGVDLTKAVQAREPGSSYRMIAGIWYGEVATGTSVTVELDEAEARRSLGFQAYSVIIPDTSMLVVTDTDTSLASSTFSFSLNTGAGDNFVVASCQTRNGERPPSATYTGTAGLTTDLRQDVYTDENHYVASKKITGANTGLTVELGPLSGNTSDFSGVAAVFQAIPIP